MTLKRLEKLRSDSLRSRGRSGWVADYRVGDFLSMPVFNLVTDVVKWCARVCRSGF
jgi:hypothetical protein